MNDISQDAGDLLTLTADIVAAHVGNNSVAISDLSLLINNVHAALSGLSHPAEKPEEPLVPAVSIRSSVKPDYIVCLEDGKKLKMLRRHLMTHYRSEEHTSELQSLMRISYAVFCLKKKKHKIPNESRTII